MPCPKRGVKGATGKDVKVEYYAKKTIFIVQYLGKESYF
jgi:hypothetical protein